METSKKILGYFLHDILPKVERPSRYIGGERGSVVKNFDNSKARIALAFPDVYEIASGNLGQEILYHILNGHQDYIAERVYAPWDDMEEKLLERSIPLFTLENKIPICEFDIIGFTVPYELNLTGVLTILNSSGLPLKSVNRAFPIIAMGGTCAFNPSVMSEYVDFFHLGDGESNITKIAEIIANARKDIDKNRNDIKLKYHLLEQIAELPGVFVPSIGKRSVSREIFLELEDAPFPKEMIIPYFGEMKNRITLEVFRGCTQGCRFCQAGYIYRPYRKRSSDLCLSIAKDSFAHTGHDEISLSSLNTTDYPELIELVEEIIELRKGRPVNIAIPSSRITSLATEITQKLAPYVSSGITLAIEAGTERLRKVINKRTSDDEIARSIETALMAGFGDFKFYFMTGLPTETNYDVEAIVSLVKSIRERYMSMKRNKEIGGNVNLNMKVSSSNFVPKPHTPFQWCAMDDIPTMIEKHNILKPIRSIKGTRLTTHRAEMSFLEGVISRGDEKIGRVIERAWNMGSRFESWKERLDYDLWKKAFEDEGVDPMEYTRERTTSENLPWDDAPSGIDKAFLLREYEKALRGEETDDCYEGACAGCGIWDQICSKRKRVK